MKRKQTEKKNKTKKKCSFAEFLGAGSNSLLQNWNGNNGDDSGSSSGGGIGIHGGSKNSTISDRNSNRMEKKMRESIHLQLYII